MANIIHKTNHSTEYVWNVVKKIRSAILVQDSCIDGVFPHTGVFFSRFSNKLQSKKEDAIALKDMNETTLAIAANIFLYLNSCPTPLKPWFVAYKQMFELKSPVEIVLALNRMMKIPDTTQNKAMKIIAEKLFIKVTQLFKLKYQRIQNISQGLGNKFWKEGKIYLTNDPDK